MSTRFVGTSKYDLDTPVKGGVILGHGAEQKCTTRV